MELLDKHLTQLQKDVDEIKSTVRAADDASNRSDDSCAEYEALKQAMARVRQTMDDIIDCTGQ